MLPLIFDDMGIPEEDRASVAEQIHQRRARTRNEYFATYGAELDRVAAKPEGEAGGGEVGSE